MTLPKPYYDQDGITIYHGDCRDILPEHTGIDMVITDPPYELGFMGKAWDKQGVSFQSETWRLVKDACKPGVMMLSFGGTRTWHRLAVAIEDAGWEIRDTLMWLYGQGFPKSLDISKAIDKMMGKQVKTTYVPNYKNNDYGKGKGGGITDTTWQPSTPEAQLWSGYGTALKPAFEPIILAMKPLDGTFAENALKHGVAGLNIDGSRIGTEITTTRRNGNSGGEKFGRDERVGEWANPPGRFPANLILDEKAGQMLDEQSGELKSGSGIKKRASDSAPSIFNINKINGKYLSGDSGGASRFFYCAKASKSERDRGCEELEPEQLDPSRKEGNPGGDNPRNRGVHKVHNNHPTVKPLALIKYLCNLLRTPTGGVLLDPFMGSGSTLIAAQSLGIKAIGIEIEEKYCEIAAKRMAQTVMPL